MDRRRFLQATSVGLASGLLAPVARSLPRTLGETAQRGGSELDALLEPVRAQHNVPALAAAFVRGSQLRAQGAVGTRRAGGSTPVQRDDRFHLGSCTKSMTATVMARLVEQGRIDWHARLRDVLEGLSDEIDPAYRDVTPVQLLAHRSGLPGVETPSAYQPLQRQLLETFHASAMRSRPLIEQRRIFARRVLARPPVNEPGTTFNYSNFGYIVAGALIEAVTGRSWEETIRAELFAPLGMASAGFGPPGRGQPSAQPWGHAGEGCDPVSPAPNADGPAADNPPVYGPAGRVHSTMADWAQYASLHLGGARGTAGEFLASESFDALHRDRSGQGYALGWGLAQRTWARGTALTHTGSNTLWYAVIWLAPQRNAAFLAATNCGSESGFAAVDQAVASMIRRFL